MVLSSAQLVSGVVPLGMTACMNARKDATRWTVRLSVARRGDWRSWGKISGAFERALAAQASKSVIAPRIDSESRRGRDYVRITLSMTIVAIDVSEALAAAWWAFRKAVGDAEGWDMASTVADVRPKERNG